MLSRIKNGLFQHRRRALAKHCADGQLKQFLNTPTPAAKSKINELEFLVADLEMTGLNPRSDKILSFGTTKIIKKTIVHSSANHQLVFHTRADLTESAPIHKIFDKDLEHGVELKQALDEFISQLEGRVLVLHHATLDKKFLNAACRELYGADLFCLTVDTMRLEHRRLSQQGKEAHQLDLANTRRRYGLPHYTSHNAAIDALATAELLIAQLSYLDPNNDLKLESIL